MFKEGILEVCSKRTRVTADIGDAVTIVDAFGATFQMNGLLGRVRPQKGCNEGEN